MFNEERAQLGGSPSRSIRSLGTASIDTRIANAISKTESFARLMEQLACNDCRGIGRRLLLLAREKVDARRQLPLLYKELRKALARTPEEELRDPLRAGFFALENLGLGEVVFVSPEGSHAKAGGLAQVITGLSEALVEQGISVSVIAPLYEEPQGNRHEGADTLVSEGVKLAGKLCPVTEVGKVDIKFGPTHVAGTTSVRQASRSEPCRVYLAAMGQLRMYFLRHPEFADRLYPQLNAKGAIERAIFLSRGALEIVRDEVFGIEPHILITNDWMAGLAPVFLATDPELRSNPRLSSVRTIHVVHNCGKGYQGRHPVHEDGADLWPLLGLAHEHYFGLADPGDRNLLNLTGGAVFHVKDAIVAVSKPYVAQLLQPEGGDGLEKLFVERERRLYGISNGVDLDDLRRTFWRLGEGARAQCGLGPLQENEFSAKSLLRYLPKYKEASKRVVQESLGLHRDKSALLLSLVSRLTEQKGIDLLVEPVDGCGRSLLEDLLLKSERVQILVAGPLSEGDPSAARLHQELSRLTRRFVGRIRGVLEFLPHARALEFAAASDLLLMPSRYEPAGISQLEALAAGTLVVARNVGGIAATLVNFDEHSREGNSFLFEEFSGKALEDALTRAVEALREKTIRRKLFRRAVIAANDWSHRVPKYRALFQYVAGVLRENDDYPFLQPQCAIVETLRPSVE